MILLLLSCVKPGGLAYHGTPPAPEEIDPITVEAQDLDCSEVLPYGPGSDPQCQGLLVPRVRFSEFLRAETAADTYYKAWEDSYAGRLEDRDYAEFRYQECSVDLQAEKTKAGVWNVVGPVGAAAFFIAGMYIGANIPVNR